MRKFLLLVCVVCCVFSCSDDVADQLAVLPALQTIVVANTVSVHEFEVTGGISKFGDAPIIDHGFIYATSQITAADQGKKVSLGAVDNEDTFSAKITGLEKNTTYYVRSFAATATDVVLGSSATIKTYNTNTWFNFPLKAVDDDPLAITNYLGMQLVMNGKAYVGFGIARGAGDRDVIPVSEYDPVNHTLTRLPDCPITYTYYPGRFAIRNKLYVINNNTREVARFDVTAKTWKILSDFPKEVSFVHSFILYNEAYVLAADVMQGNKIEIWKYNETDDAWDLVSQWPKNISPFLYSAMVQNDKVYMVVSQSGEVKLSYRWDPFNYEYTQLTAPPIPGANGDVNSSYAVADESGEFGYYVKRQSSAIWRYNPDDDTWKTFELPATGTEVCLFSLEGKLYSISNHLYQYIPE